MRSVLDDLRRERIARVHGLPVDERLGLAFALGEQDLDAFRATRSLGRREARRVLERQRQRLRRRSRCLEAVIG